MNFTYSKVTDSAANIADDSATNTGGTKAITGKTVAIDTATSLSQLNTIKTRVDATIKGQALSLIQLQILTPI